jgi:hypothetical protein
VQKKAAESQGARGCAQHGASSPTPAEHSKLSMDSNSCWEGTESSFQATNCRWVTPVEPPTMSVFSLREEVNGPGFEVIHGPCNLYTASGFKLPKHWALFPNTGNGQ